MIEINIEELLNLYDVVNTCEGPLDSSFDSHVSAITGMIGEDLVLGLFQHYWDNKRRGNTPEILSYDCKIEMPSKRKLDAWVICKTSRGVHTLYNTEIKNWSSYSRGMRTYEQPENDAEATERWQRLIETSNRNESLSKVTFAARRSDIEHKRDMSGSKVGKLTPKPLLCMWTPIATRESGNQCFFAEMDGDSYLHGVSVFSASLYLRSLRDKKTVNIKAPRAEHRLRQRERIVGLCN